MNNLQISNSFQTIIISIFANIFQKSSAQNNLSDINKDVKDLKKSFDNLDYSDINENDAKELIVFIENSIKILEYFKELDTNKELTALFINSTTFFENIIDELKEHIFDKEIENKWNKFIAENPDEKYSEIEKDFFFGIAEVAQSKNENRKLLTLTEVLNG